MKSITFILLLVLTIQAEAQFSCSADPILVRGDASEVGTYNIDTAVFSGVDVDTGTVVGNGDDIRANGIGYNLLDGYVYGLVANTNDAQNYSNLDIVRIDQNGDATNLGQPTPNNPGDTWSPSSATGTMDALGNWYGISNNQLYILDIGSLTNPGSLTFDRINLSIAGSGTQVFDIAFNPLDGNIYGVTSGNLLVQITPAGVSTTFANGVLNTADGMISSPRGGAWFDPEGRLYLYRNNSNGPVLTMVDTRVDPFSVHDLGSVSPFGQFDATICMSPNLTKDASTDTLMPGDVFSYTFEITNPYPTSPTFDFNDVLPAGFNFVLGSLNPAAPGGGSVNLNASELDISGITVPNSTNAPNNKLSFTVDVMVGQNVSPSTLNNQATITLGAVEVDSDDPDDPTLGDPTPVVVVATPRLEVNKTAVFDTDTNGNELADLDDVIAYSVTVENTGNVVLDVLSVDDPMGGGTLNCTPVILNPGQTSTCTTYFYTVTQSDVNAGGTIDNIATATAEDPSGNPIGDDDSTSTPVTEAQPSMVIVKDLTSNADGDNSGSITVDDVLTYTITATNNGNIELSGVIINDSLINPNIANCGSLEVGDFCQLVGTYTVQQSDVNAGFVTNMADTDSDQTDPVNTTLTESIDRFPQLVVRKNAVLTTDDGVPGLADEDDVITFTVEVENTGNLTLDSLIVNDPMGGGTLTCNSTTLEPSETAVCTAYTYLVTAADVAAGGTIDNLATATANDPDNMEVDGEDETSTPIASGEASLIIDKQLTGNDDADASGTISLGDTLTFTISASNNGNSTQTDVVITDLQLVNDMTTTCPTVLIGESCVLVGEYVVTQPDVNAGMFINTASAMSNEVLTPVEDTVNTPIPQNPRLAVVKELFANADGDSSGSVTEGDVLTFTISVRNAGNIPLDNMTASDSILTPSTNNCGTVAPGGVCVLTGTYTVSAADALSGSFDNTGTGSSDDTPDVDDTVNTPVIGSPSLEVTKTAVLTTDGGTLNSAQTDDVITFSVSVENTGNVVLDSLVVMDPMGGGALNCTPLTLNPMQVAVCDSYTYTVLQADVNNGGSIDNTATATADDPNNGQVSDSDSTTTPITIAGPGLNTVKELTSNADEDGSGSITLNDTLTYTITISNIGIVDLINVVVSDPMITPISGNSACATVSPGQMCQLVGTYVVQQSDIDNGQISNTGTGDSDDTNPPDTDTVVTPITQISALTVTKTATLTTDGGTPNNADVNDVITFAVSVENTGNVTLDSLVVMDPMGGGALTCSPTTLQPTEVAACNSYTYTVTQADVNNGGTIDNTATATAEDPNDNPITDDDTTMTSITAANPSLQVTKTAALTTDGGTLNSAETGDVITFSVSVENTGNVTLDSLVVMDPMGGGTLACNPITLAPMAVATCTSYTYTVTQTDVNNGGSIDNTATATADDPNNGEVSDSDSTTTPITVAGPGLNTVKELTSNADEDGSGSITLNDTLTYTITVSNIGIVDLVNVVVSDPMITQISGNSTCALVSPGQMCQLVGTYVVQQSDIDNGQISNTGTGDSDDTNPPDTDTVVTPVAQIPELTVTKTATLTTDNGTPNTADLDDVITYTVSVENTGNVTLDNLVVMDPMGGGALTCSPDTLVPGAVATCDSYTYTVTQTDIKNGGTIDNTATATAEDPSDNPITDNDTTMTPITGANPSLMVTKTMSNNADEDGDSEISIGDTLTYTIVANNNGNVTLNNVVVSDPMITPNSITCATLAIGADCELVGTYVVQQSDIDNGQISNTGTGDSDETPPVPDVVVILIGSNPDLSIVKSMTGNADEDGNGEITLGDTVSFTIIATNTGDVTLSNVVVEDTMITPASTTCASVAVDATCSLVGTYVIQQLDVDNGELTNTATAGSDETGNQSDITEITISVGPPPPPAIIPSTNFWGQLLLLSLMMSVGLITVKSRN